MTILPVNDLRRECRVDARRDDDRRRDRLERRMERLDECLGGNRVRDLRRGGIRLLITRDPKKTNRFTLRQTVAKKITILFPCRCGGSESVARQRVSPYPTTGV